MSYRGFGFGSNVNSSRFRNDVTIIKDKFYLVTLTYNGGDRNNINSYLLEVNNANSPITNSPPYANSGSTSVIANDFSLRDSIRWKGSIPVISVYNKALTTVEKTANFNYLNNIFSF